MTVNIVNYVRFKTAGGSYTSYAFQNFFVNATRDYNGVIYSYAPFVVALSAGAKGGDRTSNSLVVPDNVLSTNIFAEAALGGYFLESIAVVLDPETLADSHLLTNELWRVSTLESDQEFLSLRLMSPLDAVRGQVPRRVLSSNLVGALPTSATITTR